MVYKGLTAGFLFFAIVVGQEAPVYTPELLVQDLYQLAKDMHEVCEVVGIEYWIINGTALGAMRHGGLIPWATNLDAAMPLSQQKNFIRAKRMLRSLGYTVNRNLAGFHIRKNQAHLTLWLMKSDNEKIQYAPEKVAWASGTREGLPRYFTQKELYPLRKYPFGPLKLYGPADMLPSLRAQYGADCLEKAALIIDKVARIYGPKFSLTQETRKPALPRTDLTDAVSAIAKKEKSQRGFLPELFEEYYFVEAEESELED